MRVHLATPCEFHRRKKGAQKAAAEEEKIREPAKDAFLTLNAIVYALLHTLI